MGWICRLCGTVNMGQARKCHKCHEYDAKTIWGPWANMCRPCWESLGMYNDLGTGKGQQLELRKAGGE